MSSIIRLNTGGEDFLMWRAGSGLSVEIFDIQVSSDKRRCGRGRKLVDLLLDRHLPAGTNKVYAITRATNRIAQQFYEALKFRPIPLYNFYGEPDRFGRETVDAIMYIKDIGSQA